MFKKPIPGSNFVLSETVGDVVELVVAGGGGLVQRGIPSLLHLANAAHVEPQHPFDDVAHLALHALLRVVLPAHLQRYKKLFVNIVELSVAIPMFGKMRIR